MISEKDNEKLSRIRVLEEETSFLRWIIPFAMAFLPLLFTIKFFVSGVWDMPAAGVVFGLVGVAMLIFYVSNRVRNKEELSRLRKEVYGK